MTPETKALLETRKELSNINVNLIGHKKHLLKLGEKKTKVIENEKIKIIEKKTDEEKESEKIEAEFSPNGHIFGSVQSLFHDNGTSFGYTSDFRLNNSLLFKGAEPMRADVLVIETTFGLKEYSFPPSKEVISDMVGWVEKNAKVGLVVLAGYSIGKAQELTKISNEAGFVPTVHESIFYANKACSKNGLNLGNYTLLDNNLKDHNVVIVPPQLVDHHLVSVLEKFGKRKVVTALATGWKQRAFFNKVFPLSDHSDFNELVEYVKLANPKLVLTTHGEADSFARHLTRIGFNAKPLEGSEQKTMTEF
jgi:Cft2 family RNA processing exonuclease